MTLVVLDAMGHDDGARPLVAAARSAHAAGHRVALVGVPDALRPLLAPEDSLLVHPSGPAVAMAADAALALHERPDASVRAAAALVARSLEAGEPTALVSAGSTGATVAAAVLELGRTRDVRKPALAARIPCRDGGWTLLIDVGAVTDPTAEQLRRMAELGRDHARTLGIAAPRIGLLNVGAEPRRGNALARAAEEALAGLPGFVGNVEPGPLLAGAADVVVTDGFTGNLVLKTIEAMVADAPAWASQQDRAALLLGVRGTVLVAHGAAAPAELVSAIALAGRLARGADVRAADV